MLDSSPYRLLPQPVLLSQQLLLRLQLDLIGKAEDLGHVQDHHVFRLEDDGHVAGKLAVRTLAGRVLGVAEHDSFIAVLSRLIHFLRSHDGSRRVARSVLLYIASLGDDDGVQVARVEQHRIVDLEGRVAERVLRVSRQPGVATEDPEDLPGF